MELLSNFEWKELKQYERAEILNYAVSKQNNIIYQYIAFTENLCQGWDATESMGHILI